MKNKNYLVFLKECYPTYDNIDAAYPIGYMNAETARDVVDKFVKVLEKNGPDLSNVHYEYAQSCLVISFGTCPSYFYNIVELSEINENTILD